MVRQSLTRRGQSPTPSVPLWRVLLPFTPVLALALLGLGLRRTRDLAILCGGTWDLLRSPAGAQPAAPLAPAPVPLAWAPAPAPALALAPPAPAPAPRAQAPAPAAP
ncbi:unnamed protein product, partial [Prorocentrum cordatum]